MFPIANPLCGQKKSWGWGEGRSRGGVAARRRAGVFPGMLWFHEIDYFIYRLVRIL